MVVAVGHSEQGGIERQRGAMVYKLRIELRICSYNMDHAGRRAQRKAVLKLTSPSPRTGFEWIPVVKGKKEAKNCKPAKKYLRKQIE